jgi:hypothetical protein
MRVLEIDLDGSDAAFDRALDMLIKAVTIGGSVDIRVYGDSLEQMEVLQELILSLNSQPTQD